MDEHKKDNIDFEESVISKSQFDQLNKMPDMIHDLINDNWLLKKELYALKKEKESYHQNMNKIEFFIEKMDKTDLEIKNYLKLKMAIYKVYSVSMRKNPFKKIKAYKEMLSLYSKLK